MNITRYINDIKTKEDELSKIFIDNDTINKTIYVVNERVKNNMVSRLDIVEKSG